MNTVVRNEKKCFLVKNFFRCIIPNFVKDSMYYILN